MNFTNKISIITPIFNCGSYIKSTIESVIAQTIDNWEMLIVDDCSTDNSVDIIQEYIKKDSRIKLIKMKINSGAGPARNEAIRVSNGNYIAFLDSDDVWHQNKLERQINFMQKTQSAFTYTSYDFINEKGEIINKPYIVGEDKLSYNDLLRKNDIGCLTVILDVTKIGKVYMSDLRIKQDFDLWLRIMKRGFVATPFNEKLAFYRLRKGANTSNKFLLIKKHFTFLRKTQKISSSKTAFYMLCYMYFGVKKYY